MSFQSWPVSVWKVVSSFIGVLAVAAATIVSDRAMGQEAADAEDGYVIEDADVVEQDPATPQEPPAISIFKAVVDAVVAPLVKPSSTVSVEEAEPVAEEKTPTLADATHKQSTAVEVRGSETPAWKLAAFCTLADGRLVAAVGPYERYGAKIESETDDSAKSSQPQGELQVLDADGKRLAVWPLEFAPQTLNVAPDGSIFVGGSGKLAHLSGQGRTLACVKSPHLAEVLNDPAKLRAQAEEQVKQHEEQAKQMQQMLEQQEKQLAAMEQKKAAREKPDPREDRRIAKLKQSLESVRNATSRAAPTVEAVEASIRGRLDAIHSLAVSKEEVFIVTASTQGYGYSIWRTTHDFGEPKLVVEGLKGCCGQMDIQSCEDCLFACENSRHRVVKFDREGKELASFGKTDRKAVGEGFGSCCNPMNSRFSLSGDLFTSESNGVVKRFTPEGSFIESVGIAAVQPGCKSSIIAIAPDTNRVYYFDTQKSAIAILDRKPAATPDLEEQAAAPADPATK